MCTTEHCPSLTLQPVSTPPPVFSVQCATHRVYTRQATERKHVDCGRYSVMDLYYPLNGSNLLCNAWLQPCTYYLLVTCSPV
jgi:hypothetical protein